MKIKTIKQWIKCIIIVVTFVGIIFSGLIVQAKETDIDFNHGTIQINPENSSDELTVGEGNSIEITISPYIHAQYIGCQRADCPQICGEKDCFVTGYGCVCEGTKNPVLRTATITAVAENPDIVSVGDSQVAGDDPVKVGETQDGRLVLTGLALGTTKVTVKAELLDWISAERTFEVTVTSTERAPRIKKTVVGKKGGNVSFTLVDVPEEWTSRVTEVLLDGKSLDKTQYTLTNKSLTIVSGLFDDSNLDYQLTVKADGYADIQEAVEVHNYCADSFEVRYLDGNGKVIKTVSFSREQMIAMSKDESFYTNICGSNNVVTYKATGIYITDLIQAAGLSFGTGMSLKLRTTDGITESDSNGYYESGTITYENLLERERYYFSALYSDENLINTIMNTEYLSDEMRTALAASSGKIKVSPMIAYQYVEKKFMSDQSSLKDEEYSDSVTKEMGYRFMIGTAIDTTTNMADVEGPKAESTYWLCGVDIVDPNYVERKAQSISGVQASYSKKYGNQAFDLKAKTNGNGKLSYSSSDNKVATVSASGKVTIKGVGKAVITITASGTKQYKKATKKVSVTVKKAEQKITVSKNSYEKTYGDSAFNLNVKCSGSGKLSYKSSNTKVLKVNSKGKVSIQGTGKATIQIVAAKNANYNKATKNVTVIVKPKQMTSVHVSTKKNTVVLTWKKDTRASGYVIQYSTSSKFTAKCTKEKIVKASGTITTKLTTLKSKKKYYIRICSYKSVGKTMIRGKFSKVKSAQI